MENFNQLILSTSSTSSTSTNSLVSISISDDDNKIISIVSLGIDEEYRNKKIGSQYIKWLKFMYPHCKLDLHVSIKNPNAIKLYENNNFKIVKTIENYYSTMLFEPYLGEGIHAYYMICNDDQ